MKYSAKCCWGFLPLLLLLLCSCASSERMIRLSGSTAAPPKSSRLSSAEWKSSEQISRPLRLDSELVNLWPVYYRNNDYTSALWPLFDYDRYGLAVRPFFNREGDDYSILFPLMAWNPAHDNGWSAFVYWRKQSFGAFPLFHIGPEVKYILPVWYRHAGETSVLITPLGGMFWDENSSGGLWWPVWWNTKKESFGVLPFYYASPETDFIFPLFYRKQTPGDTTLITLFGGTRWNEQDSSGIWGPVWWNTRSESKGVFPFYFSSPNVQSLLPFYHYRGEENDSRLITPLGGGRWGKDVSKILVFGNFYMTDDSVGMFPFLFHWGKSLRQFGPLWWTTDSEYGFFPLFWNFEDFHTLAPFYWECGKNRNAGIFPLLNIPMADENARKRAYWLLPLFYYNPPSSDGYSSAMTFFTPLAGWQRNGAGDVSFWHLFGPLLLHSDSDGSSSTGIALFNWHFNSPHHDGNRYSKNLEDLIVNQSVPEEIRREAATLLDPKRDFTETEQKLSGQRNESWVTWPLVYWKRTPDEHTLRVVPADPFFLTPLFSFHTEKDEWAWNCLWLFGAHRNVDEILPEYTDSQYIELKNRLDGWTNRIKHQLQQRIGNPGLEPNPADRRLAEQVCLKAAELEIELEPTDHIGAFALQRKLQEDLYQKRVTRYNYALPFWWTRSSDDAGKWLILGGILGYGSREKENAHFRILGVLARGETSGERREFRILEFLYFSEHDGDAHRYTIFPFITYENKGEEESGFSFLWRLFTLKERNGKRSGHLFFFPFGED